ncbi:hypothetical protein LEP3755_66010 (plasmid) [Leptolyngbya sp. NIES-3755]|nr:hypothetical protein LEP3755_66010 [Leptolyngbya sp. NIES-3755]
MHLYLFFGTISLGQSLLYMTQLAAIADPRNIPTYTVVDAARYLNIPGGTLQSWLRGRTYSTQEGHRYYEPLIHRPSPNLHQLSFTNLIEAHVLRVIRKDHKVRLDKVRTALDYLEQQFQIPHPLAQIQFQTDGVNLFVEMVGRLVEVSRPGQLVMQETLQHLLQRVEWDEQGIAAKLYPLTSGLKENAPKQLVIDPRIAFGRPTLVGTGIPTKNLAARYKAGESISDLALDYNCDRLQIEEAIRCELSLQDAA